MAGYSEYLDHKIHMDWHPRKGADYTFKRVCRKWNRRWNNYGELRLYQGGDRIYWATRNADEVFLEYDAWAIDRATIGMLRSYRPRLLGVLVSNGDRYTLPFEFFLASDDDAKKAGVIFLNYAKHIGRNGFFGANQWYVPRSLWEFEGEDDQATAVSLLRIKGRR